MWQRMISSKTRHPEALPTNPAGPYLFIPVGTVPSRGQVAAGLKLRHQGDSRPYKSLGLTVVVTSLCFHTGPPPACRWGQTAALQKCAPPGQAWAPSLKPLPHLVNAFWLGGSIKSWRTSCLKLGLNLIGFSLRKVSDLYQINLLGLAGSLYNMMYSVNEFH